MSRASSWRTSDLVMTIIKEYMISFLIFYKLWQQQKMFWFFLKASLTKNIMPNRKKNLPKTLYQTVRDTWASLRMLVSNPSFLSRTQRDITNCLNVNRWIINFCLKINEGFYAKLYACSLEIFIKEIFMKVLGGKLCFEPPGRNEQWAIFSSKYWIKEVKKLGKMENRRIKTWTIMSNNDTFILYNTSLLIRIPNYIYTVT